MKITAKAHQRCLGLLPIDFCFNHAKIATSEAIFAREISRISGKTMILQREEDAVTAKPKGAGGVAQLTKLMEKAGVGGRGRHSPLSRWMQAHHDAFATMLADEDPSWNKVAVGFAKMKVHDGQGRPPTGECVRKTWWSVRQARAKAEDAKRSRTPAPPSLAPDEVAPGVRFSRVAGLGPIDVPQPGMPLGLQPGMSASTAKTSQGQPAADSSPALPGVVAHDTTVSAASLILDAGNGIDGLAHEGSSSEIGLLPSIADQAPSGVQVDLEREPEGIEASQTDLSVEVGPAAPALNLGAPDASQGLSPTSVAPAPAQPAASINPVTQDPVTAVRGEKQGWFRMPSFRSRTR